MGEIAGREVTTYLTGGVKKMLLEKLGRWGTALKGMSKKEV